MLSDLNELPAIKLTDTDYLKFELDSLTPFGQEVAAKELRETPEIKQKAIEELRKLLQGKFALLFLNRTAYAYIYHDLNTLNDFTL